MLMLGYKRVGVINQFKPILSSGGCLYVNLYGTNESNDLYSGVIQEKCREEMVAPPGLEPGT